MSLTWYTCCTTTAHLMPCCGTIIAYEAKRRLSGLAVIVHAEQVYCPILGRRKSAGRDIMSHRQDVCPAKWLNPIGLRCGPTPALVPLMPTTTKNRCPLTAAILKCANYTGRNQLRDMWALRVLARMADLGDNDACKFQAE